MATLLGILYKITNGHAKRLNSHDVTFARLESLPDMLNVLTDKVDRLIVNVAVVKNSCLYIPHDNKKAED